MLNKKYFIYLTLNVKNIEDDGITEAEIKINSIKLDASANGQKFEFEAGKDT